MHSREYEEALRQQQGVSGYPEGLNALRGIYGYPPFDFSGAQAQPPPSSKSKPSPDPVKYPGPVVPPKEPEFQWFFIDFVLVGAMILALALFVRLF